MNYGCFARTWSTLKRVAVKMSTVGTRDNFCLDIAFHVFAPSPSLCKISNSEAAQLSLPKPPKAQQTLKVIMI
jgi:hypothetical protein